MRNDVEKMNNFQNNIQQSNQFNNILYILIVLLFEESNIHFFLKFCPFLNTKQIFFLPYFIYYFIFSWINF